MQVKEQLASVPVLSNLDDIPWPGGECFLVMNSNMGYGFQNLGPLKGM